MTTYFLKGKSGLEGKGFTAQNFPKYILNYEPFLYLSHLEDSLVSGYMIRKESRSNVFQATV